MANIFIEQPYGMLQNLKVDVKDVCAFLLFIHLSNDKMIDYVLTIWQ